MHCLAMPFQMLTHCTNLRKFTYQNFGLRMYRWSFACESLLRFILFFVSGIPWLCIMPISNRLLHLVDVFFSILFLSSPYHTIFFYFILFYFSPHLLTMLRYCRKLITFQSEKWFNYAFMKHSFFFWVFGSFVCDIINENLSFTNKF